MIPGSSEKRKFIRLDALNLLDYLIIDNHGYQTVHSMGRTLDVSENGLLLEANKEISKGDTLIITVGLEDDLVDLTGSVVHVDEAHGSYAAGIEFSEISEEGRRVFKKYIAAFRRMFASGK